MTRAGLAIAEAYGKLLPKFANPREAKRALFGWRDAGLAKLKTLAKEAGVVLDQKPTSLRTLEAWYFELYPRGFARLGTDRRSFEEMMNLYLLALAKATIPKARWVVSSYGFVGGRYELGVEVGLNAVEFGGCEALFKQPDNPRHDAAYRLYCQCWNVRREPLKR